MADVGRSIVTRGVNVQADGAIVAAGEQYLDADPHTRRSCGAQAAMVGPGRGTWHVRHGSCEDACRAAGAHLSYHGPWCPDGWGVASTTTAGADPAAGGGSPRLSSRESVFGGDALPQPECSEDADRLGRAISGTTGAPPPA